MGTRNVTIVKINNEIKVAQYCQWDGYLDGQGLALLEFIKHTLNLRKLKNRVEKCTFLTNNEIDSKWNSVGADEGDSVSFSVSDQFKEIFPELHRDNGGYRVLNLIQSSYRGLELKSELSYAKGLGEEFGCEYVYELDLDNKTFKIYDGTYKESNLLDTLTFKEIRSIRSLKIYMRKLDKILENKWNS